MKVFLQRLETSHEGTFGRLIVGPMICYSGELPWRDNATNLSCIPEGSYKCKWTFSPRFKRFMYEVVGVPKRSGIRKHSANFMGAKDEGFRCQLNGCIALGEKLGWIEKQKALLISAPAVRRFESFMNREPFELEVVWA